MKLNIIREIHDSFASEHSDIRRICKYLHKWYYWSQAKQSIKRYIRNCHVCKRFKASRNKYSELLNFLFISDRSWTNIIMNFVTELLESKNYNVILMIMNRLTKMHHYIFCAATEEDINAKEIARLLINHVWKLHELLCTIISNRDSQFVSLMWKSMCKALKIDVKFSIAFHSETNDQSRVIVGLGWTRARASNPRFGQGWTQCLSPTGWTGQALLAERIDRIRVFVRRVGSNTAFRPTNWIGQAYLFVEHSTRISAHTKISDWAANSRVGPRILSDELDWTDNSVRRIDLGGHTLSELEPWASSGALTLGLGFGSCPSGWVGLKKSVRTQPDGHTRSEWDRKSKNETIFSKLLQLSTRRLIRMIIHDRIRIKCRYICVHWIFRLHD